MYLPRVVGDVVVRLELFRFYFPFPPPKALAPILLAKVQPFYAYILSISCCVHELSASRKSPLWIFPYVASVVITVKKTFTVKGSPGEILAKRGYCDKLEVFGNVNLFAHNSGIWFTFVKLASKFAVKAYRHNGQSVCLCSYELSRKGHLFASFTVSAVVVVDVILAVFEFLAKCPSIRCDCNYLVRSVNGFRRLTIVPPHIS